jgi:hypothetical protein
MLLVTFFIVILTVVMLNVVMLSVVVQSTMRGISNMKLYKVVNDTALL